MATLIKSKKNAAKVIETSDNVVGLYVRVSTKVQADGFSIDAQKKALLERCKLLGYSHTIVYEESGLSGTTTERPVFQQMLSDAKTGKITKIMATKLDRVARNVKDFLETVEGLNAVNVGVVLLQEDFDTSTPSGKFALTIFAAIAELEAQIIKDRTEAGRIEKASQGGYNGSASVYGYDYTDGVFVVNDDAATVKYIFAQFLNGKSLNSIAIELNANGIQSPKGKGKWYHVSVRYILNNGIYAGIAQYDGQFVEDKHTAIITVDQHKQAIERLQNLEKGNPNFGKKVE